MSTASAPGAKRRSDGVSGRRRRVVSFAGLVLLLIGLPLAVALDLRALSEAALRKQAEDVSAMIGDVRAYYAHNVVGRILATPGGTVVTSDYQAVPGAVPIPATLSIELGHAIAEGQDNIGYRFVSDLPFRNRATHHLDDFEVSALAQLRAQPDQRISQVSWSGMTNTVRLISPVIMSADCVSCHNTHPDSPKRDWKVGDVRGIQEVTVSRRVAGGLLSFQCLLIYFGLTAGIGAWFIGQQRRQARLIQSVNDELETANDFLSSLSIRISRYLSPQIYKSIFSGQTASTIHTQRKKLSIFFSDIKDFTSTTERLQPEEITTLLNEYLTEMSAIALKHGGTIDKFIGDAMLIFFGDPETRGTAEDARACLSMAIDMQHRLADLNRSWRARGIEHPFRVRMGISTGFCNVGNFGSSDRMDYTIVGAQANLAARLQSVAEPGQIVLSFETYALVRQLVTADELPPITMKGISQPVTPYIVHIPEVAAEGSQVISEHAPGVDLYLDMRSIDPSARERTRAVLASALKALDQDAAARPAKPTSPE